MMVKFCPKCESVLIPEKLGEGFVSKCFHCGFVLEGEGKPLIEIEKLPPKKIVGRKISEEGNEFATYKHKCPKCGFGKAQVIDVGIFYSDEDNLILLKCGKCGWSERLGRKVS
ncbi:MAG: hypothetical protein KJ879_00740 [Nanoarchaeota archaeon]|nr:hypothetical protein [Nanoarchaeota archaeon]